MRVLISGAGIAGPTLAFWLSHHGFEPTIVEESPRLRTSGYLIDFWGAGFDIAEKMGVLKEVKDKGYFVKEVKVVDDGGRRVSGFSVDALWPITHGRFVTLLRSELSAAIFHKTEDRVETIFGDTVDAIDQTEKSVKVTFKHTAAREFDLVIGADGLHSRVRELVFGEEKRFEKYLGYKAAVFEATGYGPRDDLTNVMYTQVNQQVSRFSMRDDRTMFIFVFKDDDPGGTGDFQAQKSMLRKRFGNSGWECPQILKELDSTNELYFDRVSQIRMPQNGGLWTRGRVSLVGDAASAVSLLAGQGTALAMVAAYILAGELKRAGGDYQAAFQRYQERFAPFVLQKQEAALRMAGAFAPKSKFSLFLRNQVFNLLRFGWIANLAIGRAMADNIELPDY